MTELLTLSLLILMLSLSLGLVRVLLGPGAGNRMLATQLIGTSGVGTLLLLGNLLENAYKHCLSRIQVRASQQPNRRVLLRIEDDGPGIPAHERERLLRRGERADQRHPGEGIGLAVVNEIVVQYGGVLRVRESTLGGACIELDLPGPSHG